METKHASKTCIIFIALLFFTISSIAQTWDGGAGTQNWGDAANWNPDALPTAASNVTIGSGFTVNKNNFQL